MSEMQREAYQTKSTVSQKDFGVTYMYHYISITGQWLKCKGKHIEIYCLLRSGNDLCIVCFDIYCNFENKHIFSGLE